MPGLPVINTSLLCFSLLYKLHSKKQMILMSTCAIHHSFLNCHIQYFPDDYSKSCLGLHMSTSKSLVCVMQFVTQTENKETHKLISSKYFDRHFTYQYYIFYILLSKLRSVEKSIIDHDCFVTYRWRCSAKTLLRCKMPFKYPLLL